MITKYNLFKLSENLDYPLKFKILDLTEEKEDIQLALYELSKNPKLFNEIWKEFEKDLYFMHQENIMTKYKMFKESIFVSDEEVDEMIDNNDYDYKRIELLKTDDEPIKDIINEMGEIKIKMEKINKKIDAEIKEGNEPSYLMGDYEKLNKKFKRLEKEIKSYGVQLNDERLINLMKEIRPDAYHKAFKD